MDKCTELLFKEYILLIKGIKKYVCKWSGDGVGYHMSLTSCLSLRGANSADKVEGSSPSLIILLFFSHFFFPSIFFVRSLIIYVLAGLLFTIKLSYVTEFSE